MDRKFHGYIRISSIITRLLVKCSLIFKEEFECHVTFLLCCTLENKFLEHASSLNSKNSRKLLNINILVLLCFSSKVRFTRWCFYEHIFKYYWFNVNNPVIGLHLMYGQASKSKYVIFFHFSLWHTTNKIDISLFTFEHAVTDVRHFETASWSRESWFPSLYCST